MFIFFFRNLSSSWIRTMSIVFATFMSAWIGLVFYFLYINIASGISYYTLDGVDEKRFSLTAGSNIFQLFDREKGGIPDSVLRQISEDPHIERYREFRFLDVSVLGKFDLFKFSLDIDIPTFSIRSSTPGIEGIGISSQMLKYYNLEVAGSHAFFPVFSEGDVVGRGVTLVFGASKVFGFPEKLENTYFSKITHVDPDYPGFGVVIPYAIAEKQMQKLGYTQSLPYKVVGYMKEGISRSEIESRYPNYILQFDADTITQQRHTLETIAMILVSIMIGILVILYGFLFLLLMGYFREKEYIFTLIRQYKIENLNRYILTFLEPILLILIGVFIYIFVGSIVQSYLIGLIQGFLHTKNIFFPLLSVSYMHITFIGLSSCIILLGLLLGAYGIKKR